MPDNRQRDAEFDARGGTVSPRNWPNFSRPGSRKPPASSAAFPAARLTERITPQGYDVTVLEAIAHVVEHFSQHTGQIILLTKMLTGEDLATTSIFAARAGRPASVYRNQCGPGSNGKPGSSKFCREPGMRFSRLVDALRETDSCSRESSVLSHWLISVYCVQAFLRLDSRKPNARSLMSFLPSIHEIKARDRQWPLVVLSCHARENILAANDWMLPSFARSIQHPSSGCSGFLFAAAPAQQNACCSTKVSAPRRLSRRVRRSLGTTLPRLHPIRLRALPPAPRNRAPRPFPAWPDSACSY